MAPQPVPAVRRGRCRAGPACLDQDGEMTTVAFLGLGAMGGRLAGRLVDAGTDVVVWNRTPARAAGLTERGAALAASPAEAAAAADAVITMLSTPQALREVTEGRSGMVAGLRTSTTVVEMSTVGPAAIARLAAALPVGVGLIDAPVLGSLTEADAGTLRVFVGGPAPLVSEWTPLLATFGSPLHVGPLGAGAAAKLVANSTLLGVLGVLGEAVALADGLGLSRDTTFEVLAASPLAAQAERRHAAIDGTEQPVRFTLSLARKDADLVADAADSAGVDVRLAAAVRSWLVDAERAGLGARDYSAILTRILAAR
ncbi:MAG TPA: NAD(P)-dependent oxidoreductase [Mycobacteriales bacterium]|nr:NAD(P)-dependent oxidoreductase [Mycobacteriales bacterium]